MAGKRKRGNSWEYIFKRAGVLEKPLYLSFDDEEEGDRYAARLDALLERGIVPTELRTPDRPMTIQQLVGLFIRDAHPSKKDIGALNTIVASRGGAPLTKIDSGWVDDWISEMKRVDKLAPASIRAKVGALARCCDWGMRKGFLVMPDHPLRTLPEGYAQYTKADEAIAGVRREDVERDRRLEEGEFEQALAVLAGGVLARKQRPLVLEHPRALRCLMILAVESAMRLREMFTLHLAQLDLPRRTVFLDKTKNGDKRQVPLSSVALAELRSYLDDVHGPSPEPGTRLFPWWNGEANDLDATSDYLSKLFIDIFSQAGAQGLKFHDLRHEATSRLFERTQLSDTQIMKITGHKSQRMLMRYANLRASDLSKALW
ncbi:site-specific integrase [Paracidovorax citrulli]|uniref:Phage integrase family protein n=4 Tax=Pseudomonadota TaxID=1224 RepID=A1TMR6_PARC0|nr:site-specific integrase [Paracidovorax citrulli]ABM32254.1 phage integrase family protein [Paracidovorax citrulli AAC00-1]ATG94731.1 site-specific integrase [Paracidovorax citrulli]PVY66450.1 site-specific recombinase XerC [Paracidovorax citrulli]QCX12127.1 Tyrosine recombinase XerC [Paracidovorax citrulli]REG69380.1 site-specific recombinase XerC [Paracidovorax citrulli]